MIKLAKSLLVSLVLISGWANAAQAQIDFERLGFDTIQDPVEPLEPDAVFGRQAAVQDSGRLPAFHHYVPDCDYSHTIQDDLEPPSDRYIAPYEFIPINLEQIVEDGSPQFVETVTDSGTRFDAISSRTFSSTGQWHVYDCRGGSQVVPVGEETSYVELIAQAWANLEITQPDIKALPEGNALVNLQTFYSIDSAWFAPKTATASAGRFNVEVTFEPINTVWNSGEPGTTSFGCPLYGFEGDLEIYSSRAFRCGHTYRQASQPGEPFEISVDTLFNVTATSNIESLAVEAEELPQMKVRHSRTIEVEALESRLVTAD